MIYTTQQKAEQAAAIENLGSDTSTVHVVKTAQGFELERVNHYAKPAPRKPSGTPKDKAKAAITKKHGAAGWQKFIALHGEKDAYRWHIVAYFKG